jgi:hypothetical protein
MLKQCSSNAQAMRQAMPQQCVKQCPSNAQACRMVTLCGWCARPTASMSRSCAAAAEVWGRSPVQSLIAKSIAGLGQGGRQDCRGAQQRSNLFLSHPRLVSLFETASCFRGSKGEIRAHMQRNRSKALQKCFGLRRLEIRLMSHVSCHRPISFHRSSSGWCHG